MDTKAISPLIATILLIGFVIGVAAIVMLWGQTILKEQLEKTAPFSQAKLDCQTDVEIDIQSAACDTSGTVVVEVENLKGSYIANFRGRVSSNQGATTSVSNTPLEGYGTQAMVFTYDSTDVGAPEFVEVLPIVYSENVPVTCESQLVKAKISRSGTC